MGLFWLFVTQSLSHLVEISSILWSIQRSTRKSQECHFSRDSTPFWKKVRHTFYFIQSSLVFFLIDPSKINQFSEWGLKKVSNFVNKLISLFTLNHLESLKMRDWFDSYKSFYNILRSDVWEKEESIKTLTLTFNNL
jgi:hypothetical protein